MRLSEADAAHLLEAVAVVIYDLDIAEIDPGVPASGSHLRWDEFVEMLAEAYDLRFE